MKIMYMLFRSINSHVSLSAVLPLLNITIIRVPHVDRLQNVTQDDGHVHMTFMQGESFQWPCAVTAGEGDQLQWLLNDSVVNSLSTTGSVPLEVCSIESATIQ